MSLIARTTLISIIALGGCATVLKSKTATITVSSTTPGAAVFVDGKQAGVTPMNLALSHKTDAVISVQHDNREETCRMTSHASVGWIIADILVTGGLGVIVDWATSGWNNLSPATCHVAL